MRIRRNAEQPPSSIPRRLPASAGYAIFLWLPLLLLFGLWRPWGVPVASLLAMALGIAALCHISWTFVWRRRLAREERAAAAIRRQRLAAALSRGPRPAPPQPGPDPDARRRRALLDAVDKHGAISPEARAAADAIAEHRTK